MQEMPHLLTNHRIQSIERAEKHHIVRPNRRQRKLQPVVLVVFIKHIVGIVLRIEKGQRKWRFHPLATHDLAAVNAILIKKIDNLLPHAVSTRLADETARHTRATQRNQTVERGTSRNSTHRLISAENNIENSLAYTYNLAHK